MKKLILVFLMILGSNLAQGQVSRLDNLDPHKSAKASQAFRTQQFKKAAQLYYEVASANPERGFYWYRAAMSYIRLKDIKKAHECFKKCVKTSGHSFMVNPMLGLARTYAMLNQPKEAIATLKKLFGYDVNSMGMVYQLPEFQTEAYQKNPAFLTLFGGKFPGKQSRMAGWRFDLSLLAQKMEEVHYNLFAEVDKTVWRNAVKALEQKIPQLKDYEIIAELMKLVALDRSTYLYPLTNGQAMHRLPINIYWFDDGIFIRAATSENKALVGAKILKIGDQPIEKLQEVARKYITYENEMSWKARTPRFLQTPELLMIEKATNSLEKVKMTVEIKGKTKVVTIKALTFAELVQKYGTEISKTPNFDERTPIKSWVSMQDPGRTPLYLEHPYENYRSKYFPEQNVFYTQFNFSGSKKGESIIKFCNGMTKKVNEKSAKAWIIDLRFLHKGSVYSNRAIMEALVKASTNLRGKIFGIIGRETYHVGQHLAQDMEYRCPMVWAGEATGGRPNFAYDNNILTLPYSGIKVNIPHNYVQGGPSRNRDKRQYLGTYLGVGLTSQDYKEGFDPALEAILKYIKTDPRSGKK
ncbi:MAG TPA: hypothetical protein DCS93_01505 [Microscillaceae bacterium]|nr:hypothetical protein [Microscillaceae bacterium]